MRKKNFEIREGVIGTIKVKGFHASIKTPGKFKFGVCKFQGKWRTTELSTGLAIPGSFADSAEDSVKKAQTIIDGANSEKTYFQGIVAGINQLLLEIQKEGK